MHLSLALAGVCLTCAELPYLPELPVGLVVYLGLIWLSWRRSGRWKLATWVTNLLGVVIAGGVIVWMLLRINPESGNWASEVPMTAVIIPYLGPLLMAVLVVRLFRTPNDFWALQAWGLLLVSLGCVLANETVFVVCLLLYFVVAVGSLAVHERRVQAKLAPLPAADPRLPREKTGGVSSAPSALFTLRSALGQGLRWAPAVAAVAIPLFLLTPQVDVPDWDPLARFGVQSNRTSFASMGFSEEIDLMRVGVLETDDSPAFTVQVTDDRGTPVRALPPDSRWRGTVLDRYEEGMWRTESDLTWPARVRAALVSRLDRGPDALALAFRVPRRAGGLFLADPLRLREQAGELPIEPDASGRLGRGMLFFEAGGTAMPLTYLTEAEYRYMQTVLRNLDRNRYPAMRLTEGYQTKLLRSQVSGLGAWSLDLVVRLARQVQPPDERLLAALARRHEGRAHLPPAFWEPVARLLTHHLAHSGEYTWSLELRRGKAEMDPVMDFLVNVKQGHCERFASALALMLRAQGIPARIVKGFRGCDYQGEGTYVVRNSHAHAWVEALVPSADAPEDFTWLVLDPTPEGELSVGGSTLERLQRSGKILWRDLILGYNTGDQADLWEEVLNSRLFVSLTVGLLLVPALLGVWWLRRRRRRAAATVGKEAPHLYARLRQLLERYANLQSRPDETPGELAGRATPFLARQEATAALAAVPARVVAVYYAMRFGGRLPEQEVLREAADALDQLTAALRRGRLA
jgi:hypothetical protein